MRRLFARHVEHLLEIEIDYRMLLFDCLQKNHRIPRFSPFFLFRLRLCHLTIFDRVYNFSILKEEELGSESFHHYHNDETSGEWLPNNNHPFWLAPLQNLFNSFLFQIYNSVETFFAFHQGILTAFLHLLIKWHKLAKFWIWTFHCDFLKYWSVFVAFDDISEHVRASSHWWEETRWTCFLMKNSRSKFSCTHWQLYANTPGSLTNVFKRWHLTVGMADNLLKYG